MSEFVPKTTGNLGNPDAGDQSEDMKGFTPKKQDVESRSDSGQEANNPTFKKLQSENLPTTSPNEAEPLKNIQVPAEKAEDSDEGAGDTVHRSKVNVVRDGNKITQIIVECKCGETIPLDCIY
ncbi:MAG: hypothetical protein QF600_07680 [Verrucomicrobiota bacterium]|jgi:hypothetical protein|nr:hypothetical protein [Verrucomicrobiota bacterium]